MKTYPIERILWPDMSHEECNEIRRRFEITPVFSCPRNRLISMLPIDLRLGEAEEIADLLGGHWLMDVDGQTIELIREDGNETVSLAA